MPTSSLTVVTDVKSLALERGWRYVTGVPESVQRRGPSLTTAEEAGDLLRQFAGRASEHYDLRKGESVESAERDYARLYAVSEYPCEETFLCEIPEARLAGELGVVVTSRSEILVQSLAYGGPMGAKLEAIKGATGRITGEVLPGTYLSLLGFGQYSYAHWLLDLLPRLALVPAEEDGFRVLVPSPPRPFETELLELLGIGADRIVPHTSPNVCVERLLLSHPTPRTTRPAAAHLRWVRERLLSASEAGGVARRRIYVSRAGARRQVVNEDELLPVLAEHGFETVPTEQLGVREQVRLFAEAEAIAGAHGAGLHNHIFAPAGACVLELYNPGYLGLAVLGSASLLGHEHWHLFGAPAGDEFDIRVDPGRFERLLAFALAGDG